MLVVLYGACLLLRLPVTPMEIQGQALSGALPFFEHLGRAGEALDPADQLGLSALLKRPGDPPFGIQSIPILPARLPVSCWRLEPRRVP